jgi:hypothetical protein
MSFKICFITELPFIGKVDTLHENMRTEFAWMNALDADNIHISKTNTIADNTYDLGIIIIPKSLENYTQFPIISELSRICKYSAFMQEGPSWYYQSLPIKLSILHFNIMNSVDFVFAHNDCDKLYFEGLLNKPTFINPTLLIENSIGKISNVNRTNVIIGGNLGRWYGGFDSYVVSTQFDSHIYFPSMGRMEANELEIPDIHHLPYMNLKQWIHTLNTFKYAVHLNPNTIGGTFNLNCAFLGIPCIGNIDANTQRKCFPYTSVDVRDISKAKQIANQLKTDDSFYTECSDKAKKLYNLNFSQHIYSNTMFDIFNKILK